MAVRSLRSLCLERVYTVGLPVLGPEELPGTLARHLARARLFSGNFLERSSNFSNNYIKQTGLTIRFRKIWSSVQPRKCVLY
jgi:hypothetical protein